MARPGRTGSYTILLRRLRKGETIPLTVGSGDDQVWAFLHQRLVDGKALRIAGARQPEYFRQNIYKWCWRHRDKYPILRTMRSSVRRDDKTGEDGVIYFWFTPLERTLDKVGHKGKARHSVSTAGAGEASTTPEAGGLSPK